MTTHHVDCSARVFYRFRDDQRASLVLEDDQTSDFQTGDTMVIRESGSSWNIVRRQITHVLREAEGLHHGYVVVSLEDQRVKQLAKVRAENDTRIRSNRALRARAKRLTAEAQR